MSHGSTDPEAHRASFTMKNLALELVALAIRIVVWFAPVFLIVGAAMKGGAIAERHLESKGIPQAELKRRVARARELWAVAAIVVVCVAALLLEWMAPQLARFIAFGPSE
jgi:hypothetical protein